MNRYTTDSFIKRALEIHGDRYTYNKVEYVNWNKKICITCKEHGDFYKTPAKHLYGQGCPKCSKRTN